MNSVNRRTVLLDRALAMVLVRYPVRTGLGVAFGGTLGLFVQLFEPSLEVPTAINLLSVPRWAWIAPGILLMHLPTIVAVFKQRLIGNDEVDLVLELIERGNFSAAEKRHQYRLLIERVRESIQSPRDRTDGKIGNPVRAFDWRGT